MRIKLVGCGFINIQNRKKVRNTKFEYEPVPGIPNDKTRLLIKQAQTPNSPLSLRRNLKNKKQMSNRTFTMIKPDAMKNGHAGAILDKIIKAGFRIVALKQTQLTREKAGEFYAVHKERPFYGELVQFMSSGLIIAAILEKNNAVTDFRTLIGATDPSKADEGTIRKLYATSLGENAVHGSDSDENARIEGSFFFSGLEQF
jgi:nucleoside-diphosphate kinase